MSLGQAVRADLARITDSRKPYTPLVKWLLTPAFKTMVLARLATRLAKRGKLGKGLGRLVWRWNVASSACYISFDADIGDGLLLPHPTGIVIGDDVRIGEGVTIYQNVTLGRANAEQSSYPVIGDGVIIYAGAVIVGAVTVGAGAVVAANSVVNRDVPPGAVVGGVPAKVLVRR
jgi:serine O-acetyltransferase